ncbi:predicted protein [Sclerotinia sclerotiorum 1980 UF-70]|uniref:Uncharacterized protein n=1 Tax=Sclerotinia sclerotiorum (strain ATCC 18683 / 1980 / Ss-1) TaxID=665079 RepID=A7ENP8_SCLS1|nr:predicted protein [Sclerotinia sclerotiorum 1980 UF-70]EDO04464.1 predicted protein [Sclerotinia sclerotiorum 1980 UF-70]
MNNSARGPVDCHQFFFVDFMCGAFGSFRFFVCSMESISYRASNKLEQNLGRPGPKRVLQSTTNLLQYPRRAQPGVSKQNLATTEASNGAVHILDRSNRGLCSTNQIDKFGADRKGTKRSPDFRKTVGVISCAKMHLLLSIVETK